MPVARAPPLTSWYEIWLTEKVSRKSSEAFAQMVADAKAMNLGSVDGPLSREEANERD